MIDRCKLCVVTVTCDSWYKENNWLPQLIGLNRKQILNYSNNNTILSRNRLIYLCEQSKITPNLNILFIKCKNLFSYYHYIKGKSCVVTILGFVYTPREGITLLIFIVI